MKAMPYLASVSVLLTHGFLPVEVFTLLFQRASVRLKARQSLLLLSGLPGGPSAELLSADTQLAELLAGRLQELHALLPADTLDAAALQSWPHTPWRYTCTCTPRDMERASGI